MTVYITVDPSYIILKLVSNPRVARSCNAAVIAAAIETVAAIAADSRVQMIYQGCFRVLQNLFFCERYDRRWGFCGLGGYVENGRCFGSHFPVFALML